MEAKLEIFALVLGFIGLMGTVAITAMPMWRVTAFIGANLIVMEELWEGLWMNCISQMDIQRQCKVYDSLLILPAELQASRGLACVSIVLVVIALFVTWCGSRRSTCGGDNMKCKNITLAIGGCVFLLSCLTTLIPVSWVAHAVIRHFYNPLVADARKRELGPALYVGWATSGVLLLTGVIILFIFFQNRAKEEEPYAGAHLMEMGDVDKQSSVRVERNPSSFHRHHEYV